MGFQNQLINLFSCTQFILVFLKHIAGCLLFDI